MATLAVSGAAQAATIPSNEVLTAWYDQGTKNTSPKYAHQLTSFDDITIKKGTKGTPLTNKGVTLHETGGSITATLTGHGDAEIFNGNSTVFGGNGATAPFGDKTNYLAIGNGGSATFSLSQPAHYFGFEWSSVDTFNSVSFYDGTTLLGTIGGSDLKNHGGSTGSDGTYYANFTSNLPITSVVMSSKGTSFEVDNISISSVPVPAALPLFGAAVAGLGAMGKRRRKKAAAAA
jgi:hypothetical protein